MAYPTIAASITAMIAVAVGMEAFAADPSGTPGLRTQDIVVAEPQATTQPAAAPLLPHFDRWARQPRLRCRLPAIGDWQRVTHSDAKIETAPSAKALGTAQLIFAQQPPHDAGDSKYSVIYAPARQDITQRVAWYEMTFSFFVTFRSSLLNSGRFQKVEVTTPTVIVVGDLRRFHLDYRLETQNGRKINGAVLGAPARRGVLFFNLALEGHGPDAVEAVMQELRPAVTKGLARYRRPVLPWVVAALLALPLIVGGVVYFRRRRDMRSETGKRHAHPTKSR